MPDDTLCSTSYIPAQAPQWLWPRRLARGRITAIIGDPVFPTLDVVLDLAARISAGIALPGSDALPPGRVLVIAGESRWREEWLPRLTEAGAVLSSIDVAPLPSAIRNKEYALTVLPNPATLLGDLARDQSVPLTASAILRHAAEELHDAMPDSHLAPAVIIAAEPGPGSNAMSRGANVLRGQPHIPLAFSIRGEAGGPYVLAPQRAPSFGAVPLLYFALEAEPAATYARVIWRAPKGIAEVREWLASLLADGPRAAAAIKESALHAGGISGPTLYRARQQLGVIAPGGPGSIWRLPA